MTTRARPTPHQGAYRPESLREGAEASRRAQRAGESGQTLTGVVVPNGATKTISHNRGRVPSSVTFLLVENADGALSVSARTKDTVTLSNAGTTDATVTVRLE